MRLLIIGAGGHAKVVAGAAVEAGWEIAGVVDETGTAYEFMGLPVSPSAEDIEADAFVVAIGDNRARAERFAHYLDSGMTAASIVHPRATIDPTVMLGSGVVAFAGVVVNAAAIIGNNVVLNTGCTVDHDCIIGAHTHIGPGANLCGSATVGEGVLMGVGSCSIPGAWIGDWAVVGAGAAVIDTVPEGSTVVGVPAKPV